MSRPTHVARCWRGHSCPYHARKCCWFLHDEDGEGCARAAFPLPPASLLVRLSSLLEQIAEVLKVIQQRIVEPIVDEPVPLAEFVGEWEQIVDVPVPRIIEDDVDQIAGIPVPQITGNSLPFVPQERVQNRVAEQIVGIPVPQLMEAVVEVTPQERVQNRMPVQIVDVPVPQITENSLPFVPQERVQNCTLEQIVGVPAPQLNEAPVDVVLSTPQERVQNCMPVQIVDVPVPQLIEASLPFVPQERVLDRTQQIVGVPVLPIMEAAVEVVREKTLEPVQNRTQPIVDSPVPQFMEAAVKNRCPEQIVNSPMPQFMEAAVENCVGEQIVDSPVPQFTEAAVEKCVGEQIVDCPLPQIMEAIWPSTPRERVQNRTPELILDPPVPQLKDATLLSTPQERVLNRTQEQIMDSPCLRSFRRACRFTLEQVRVHSRIQEQIVDLPVPQTMAALRPKTGKVFTVEMPHQHVHQACPGDHVLFNIKGLDKHNMPRSGDVMVPAAQIQEQIVDVGGSGIVREIPEEKVVERIQDSAAFGGAEHDQQETPAGDGRCSSSSSVPWRPELHPSWRQTVARDGSVYFWHVHTRQTQWDPPKDDEGEDEHFDTEDVEEDDARGIGSRFHGSFRPMRMCRVFGAGCCWRGAECSFAHSASELHPLSPDLHL